MKIFLEILSIIGALGLFIYGMKIMSESLQKLSGGNIRGILSAMTANKFKSLLSGVTITAIVQSSSAVTVMIVSLVNAGLLSLLDSATLIMGANIGTTIKAWIIAFLGFQGNLSLSTLLLPLIAVGLPLFFSKNYKVNLWAEFIFGFVLLFIGLDFLKQTIPLADQGSHFLQNLSSNYTGHGFVTIIIFFLVGLIITTVFQSSSAMLVLTFVLATEGWINLWMAAAMVLGENVGTTTTAMLASLVGNRNSKRSALIHVFFNIIGVTWALIIFNPLISVVDDLTSAIMGSSPSSNAETIPVALAILHTGFNLVNTLLLVGFTRQLAKLPLLLIKVRDRKDISEKDQLIHIKDRFVSISELSIVQAQKEIAEMARKTMRLFEMIPQLLLEIDDLKYDKLLKKIKKREESQDNLEEEISGFLDRIAKGNIGDNSGAQLNAMYKIVDDLENMSNICFKMSSLIKMKKKEGIYFVQEQRDSLSKLFEATMGTLQLMKGFLSFDHSRISMEEINNAEANAKSIVAELRKKHLADLQQNIYNANAGAIYSEMITLAEQISLGAHRIAQAVYHCPRD